MPISLRRWKQKATKYINEHFKATGEGTLNHDLKMYLEFPEFKPLFDESVARINGGVNEDEEIENMIRQLARNTLTSVMEVAEERRPRPKKVVERHYVDDSMGSHEDEDEHLGGKGITHHYHYYY